MSTRHPLSRKKNKSNLLFFGAIVLLLLLALSVRWARNPSPVVLPSQNFPSAASQPGVTIPAVAPALPQVASYSIPVTAATPYVSAVSPPPLPAAPVPVRSLPAFWKMAAATPPVNAILRDPKGVVWAATEGGLARVENNLVTMYTRANGFFPTGNATSLAHDGVSLWIGTFEGLYQTTDGRGFRRYQKAQGLAHDMVWSLEWDQITGILWIGTQEGFSFMLPDGRLESVDKKISNGGLADLWVGSIKKLDRWALCGNDDGLSVWDTASMAANPTAWKTVDMFASNLAHNWILSMAVGPSNTLWAGTPLGLCRLETPIDRIFSGNLPNWRVFTQSDGLPSLRIDSLVAAGNDVWVGTPEGLARLRGNVARVFRYADGLLASDVRAISAAPEMLWVGTSAGIQALDFAQMN